jgi:hypothetical protein
VKSFRRKQLIMRTILITALSVLSVLSVLTVSAQPAAADDPDAVPYGQAWDDARISGCETPYRTGVLGQYGAQGYFIDGCTASTRCPVAGAGGLVKFCIATGYSRIQTQNFAGHYVTMNSRVRRFSLNAALIDWHDASCGPERDLCSTSIDTILLPGQLASTQCNGVRENAYNTAFVMCQIYVEYRWI